MASDFYKNLPKKRMAAGVLLFNEQGELLVVKPTYKEGWSIPGGGVDESESPRAAAIRETREEVGIEIKNLQFLCVDYISAHGEKTESLQFIFYGGVLSPQQIQGIKIPAEEISEYRFVSTEEVIKLFGTVRNLARRLPKCLEAITSGTAVYLEDGEFEQFIKKVS